MFAESVHDRPNLRTGLAVHVMRYAEQDLACDAQADDTVAAGFVHSRFTSAHYPILRTT
jgi:hypothetical protein